MLHSIYAFLCFRARGIAASAASSFHEAMEGRPQCFGIATPWEGMTPARFTMTWARALLQEALAVRARHSIQ